MLARLQAGEPFHLATWLRPAATELAPELLARHLRRPVEEQQRLLEETLIAGGTSPRVAWAVAAAPRHRLAPEGLQERAFLDEFLRGNGWFGLTPPSLVAAMIERLGTRPAANVLELGVGSACHAVSLLRLWPTARLVGIEGDGRLLAETRERSRDLAEAARLHLIHGVDPDDARAHAPFDVVYATFAYRRPVAALVPLLAEDGRVQVPRAVTPHELATEPLLQPLRDRHPSYESFLEEWQINLCVTTYVHENGNLRVVDKLYGVSFVGQRDQAV